VTDPVREWVEASCQAQGLAVKIADSTVLIAVAELLGVRQVKPPSDAPDRGEARRVETVVAASSRTDDDVIEDGADNYTNPRVGEHAVA
jgi:hypothetical protein